MAERQPFRHRLSPDPRAQISQGPRQPGQILVACFRSEVDISCRWYRGPLGDSRESADDDVAHLVPVQRSDYGCWVQAWFAGPALAAQAAPSTGTAARHAAICRSR
jgi:hypothetical protein